MADTVFGGPNKAVLFPISSAAFGTTAEITLTLTASTDVQRQADGTFVITTDSVMDDDTLQTFLSAANPVGASATTNEVVTLENGQTVGGGNANSVDYGMIIYGNVMSAGTKRKTWRGVVNVEPTSGSWKQEAGKANRPKLVFNSKKVTVAHSVPVACFDTSLVTAPGAPKSIEQYCGGVTEFLTEA